MKFEGESINHDFEYKKSISKNFTKKSIRSNDKIIKKVDKINKEDKNLKRRPRFQNEIFSTMINHLMTISVVFGFNCLI